MKTQTLGTTAELPNQIGQRGAGIYLLTRIDECERDGGERFLRLALEDATGMVEGIAWAEALPCVERPHTPAPVRVRGTVRCFKAQTQIHVESLAALGAGDVPSASALLPLGWCPVPARHALSRLGAMEEALTEPLDGFLRQVLLDPAILRGLLTCRGSGKHHHAYPGGLLVHSTEMLDLARSIVQRVVPDDPRSPQLAQLGYLLHDLGKLRSVGATTRPAYPFATSHEHYTIELLAPHLRWLELRDVDLAAALRHILGYLATPQGSRRPPDLAAAEIVAMLDQVSAAAHHQRDFENFRHDRPRSRARSQHVAAFPSGRTRPRVPGHEHWA